MVVAANVHHCQYQGHGPVQGNEIVSFDRAWVHRRVHEEAELTVEVEALCTKTDGDAQSVTVTRLWAGRPGFDSRQRQGFLSTPKRPDRPWSPHSLLSEVPAYSGWGVKLITHLYIVPRLRMHGAIPPLPQKSS